MAVTLAQSAILSQNNLQRGVLETFIQLSVVLDKLPLIEIEGNAYAYDAEATLPGIEFRAVNSSYAEATGTVNQVTESLVILGGDADVDRFIVQTRGNLNDQRAVQTQLKVKAATYKFQDAFINGDTAVDANSFDGLKKRLTGAQVITAGANGLPVIGNGTSDIDALLDVLDQAIYQVYGPNNEKAIYVNAATKQRITSAARRKLVYTTTQDGFGRTVEAYNGIPIFDIGTSADGSTQILPFTEAQGTDSATTSMYVVRFGNSEADAGVTGLTNGGVDVRDLGELDVKPVFRTRIEFYCGLAVFGGHAAVRVKGIKNS